MRDQFRGEVRLTPRQRRVAVEVVKVLTSQEAISGPAPSVETVELLLSRTFSTWVDVPGADALSAAASRAT
jgi:hypothetical protein